MKTDVLIIGGGVIGCGIAHQLCKYNFDVTLVEKEADVCMGTSKANSSMLHDGYNVDRTKLKGQISVDLFYLDLKKAIGLRFITSLR